MTNDVSLIREVYSAMYWYDAFRSLEGKRRRARALWRSSGVMHFDNFW